jgi:CBS domain-containing protein
MQVKEITTRNIEVIHPDCVLQEAAEEMKTFDIGALPVCDNGQLLGMLTDRDITVRSAAAGYDPARDRVRFVMTPEVIYCFEDQDVAQAGQLMKHTQVRRLPVLNRDKRLVGILSLDDLAVKSDEVVGGNTRDGLAWPMVP